MPIYNICGWESGSALEAFGTGGTFSIQSIVKRSGGFALRCNPTGAGTGYCTLGAQATTGGIANLAQYTIYVRVYFRVDTKPASGNEQILRFAGAASNGNVRINSSGNLAVYDSGGTLVATGSTVLATDGTWYRIEVKWVVGNPGDYEVKINGVSELSGTANLGLTVINVIGFGKQVNVSGQSVDYYFDDICIRDDAYPGEGQIELMQPDADGNYTTWTIGAGPANKWDCVDEAANDGDTSYLVSTSTSGNAYTAALESTASAGITGIINAVKSVAIVKRDGASNGAITLRLRSGATDDDTSADYATGSAYAHIAKIYATDPATNSAWALSALGSIEVGAVEKSAANKSRLTAAYAMVDFIPKPRSYLSLLGIGW